MPVRVRTAIPFRQNRPPAPQQKEHHRRREKNIVVYIVDIFWTKYIPPVPDDFSALTPSGHRGRWGYTEIRSYGTRCTGREHGPAAATPPVLLSIVTNASRRNWHRVSDFMLNLEWQGMRDEHPPSKKASIQHKENLEVMSIVVSSGPTRKGAYGAGKNGGALSKNNSGPCRHLRRIYIVHRENTTPGPPKSTFGS